VFRREPVYVCDTKTDPRWQSFLRVAEDFGIAACWSVPILSTDGDAVGSFAISHTRQREPTAFEEQVMLTASHIAGIAIKHHHATRALRTSEEKFRDLYDLAPDMFASVDIASCRIDECNRALADKLGYSKIDLLGMRLLDFYHPQCHADVLRCNSRVLETGELDGEELQLVTKSGQVIDISLNVSAVRDAEGKIVRSRSILRDITAQKRVEQDLRRRIDYQALLVDLSSQLICARPADLDQQLDVCLEKIGNAYELDAIGVWWFTKDRDAIRAIRRWERRKARNLPSFRHRVESNWISDHIAAGQIIAINDLAEMPPQTAIEREEFRRWGTKSYLMIPLLVDDRSEGVVFYSTLRKSRTWSSDDVTELKLVSEFLAGAIARTKAMAAIEQYRNRLQEENVYLKEEIRAAHGFDEIIGNNAQLVHSLQLVEKVAPTDVTVLVLGETGTGKELIARALHKLSARHGKPLISVNCPALPSTLIESELFGHEKGAFTGAQAMRKGRFELANGGTLFLDEVGDFPLYLQSKLLRVLQSGEFERLGGTETRRVDVRLIAATNRDLKQEVEQGAFRADLYYRIGNFPIQLPALRERKDDIPLLAEHFLRKHAGRLNKNVTTISSSMLEDLVQYSWPGNIRELESIIERALISSTDGASLKLASPLRSKATVLSLGLISSTGERVDLATVERSHILRVLNQTEWTIAGKSGAANALGMPPSTLRSKMKRLGISR
jgi:PAS domain S-box-containing protein